MDLRKSFAASYSKIQGIPVRFICTSYEFYRSMVVVYLNSAKLLRGVVTGCEFLMVLERRDSRSL